MLVHQEMKPRNHSEGLGISLKIIKILRHLGAQKLCQGLPPKLQLPQILFKPILDRRLPEMPKGRIPNIVQKPGALENVADRRPVLREEGGILYLRLDLLSHILPQ